jgi:peptidoglycan/LPS O-acetylase OafA/YrhL
MHHPRLCFLDGLRGWGAASVLLYHTFVEIFPVSVPAREAMWRVFLFNGTFAVSIFFLVSGISLSIGFIRKPDRIGLLKIGLGRYVRLTIPILIACLFAWAAANSGATLDPTHRDNATSLASVLRFATFDVYANNNPALSPIPPLWTMPTELAGSAIVLVLLAVVRRSWTRSAIFAAAVILLWQRSPNLSAFVIGIAIAECFALAPRTARWRELAANLCIVLAMVTALFLPRSSEGHYVLVATLMVFGVSFSSLAITFLETGISRWLGKISFPLYCLHSIVIYSFGSWLQARLPTGSVWFVAAADCAIVAVCLAAAHALVGMDRAGIGMSRVVSRSILNLLTIRCVRARLASLGKAPAD